MLLTKLMFKYHFLKCKNDIVKYIIMVVSLSYFVNGLETGKNDMVKCLIVVVLLSYFVNGLETIKNHEANEKIQVRSMCFFSHRLLGLCDDGTLLLCPLRPTEVVENAYQARLFSHMVWWFVEVHWWYTCHHDQRQKRRCSHTYCQRH